MSNKMTVTINGKEYVSKEAKKAADGLGVLEKKAKAFKDTTAALKVGAVAFAAALIGIYKALTDTEKAFFEQEKAVSLLSASLRASGQSANGASFELQKFASDLQKITTVGDETSIQLQQIAISSGATAQQAKQATKDAIGLSKAFGVDLQSAIKATTNAQQGNYDMLSRYMPTLRSAASETEKQAIAEKLLGEAFTLATAEAATNLGTQEQLNNTWGDTKELLGEIVSNGLTPFRRELNNVLTELNNNINKNKELKAAMDFWKNGASDQNELEKAYAATKSQLQDQLNLLEELNNAKADGERTRGNTGARLRERESEIAAINRNVEALQNLLNWQEEERRLYGELQTEKDRQAEAEAERVKWTNERMRQQGELARQFAMIAEQEKLFGDQFNDRAAKESAVRKTLQEMIEFGFTAEGDGIRRIMNQYGEYIKVLEEVKKRKKPDPKNKPEKEVANLTVLDRLISEMTDELNEQLKLKNDIARVDQMIIDAMNAGNVEWLGHLQDIREELLEIAGIESEIGAGSTPGLVSADSPDYGGGGSMDTILSTVVGNLEGFSGALASAVLQYGDMGLIIAAINEIMAGLMETVGPLLEEVLKPISLMLRTVGAIIGQILSPLLEALGPILELLAKYILNSFKNALIFLIPFIQILSNNLQMLEPVMKAIVWVSEQLGKAFLWLYNEAVRPFANLFIAIGNILYNAAAAVANGFIYIYNLLVKKSKEKDDVAYRDVDAGFLQKINMVSFNSAAAAAEASYANDYSSAYGGSYGGGTTVQQPSPIYITQNFNNSPIIGPGGLEEFGEMTVAAIQEYSGAGGKVTFLEAS